METPEEKAARLASEAAEDAAASGGFEDDDEPVLTPADVTPPAEEPEEEPEVPAGAADEDAVKRLIKAERKAARQANAKARELEAKLAELEAKPAAPAAPAADNALAIENLKLKVALRKGLSETIAVRLQGATEEEIAADADALLAEMGPRPGAGMDGGFRPVPPVKTDPVKQHNADIVALLTAARNGQQ